MENVTFDDVIRVSKTKTIRDENDYPKEVDVFNQQLACAYFPVSGREYFEAAQTESENTARFVVWYRTDLDTDMKLDHESGHYEIESILRDKGGKMTMTIVAKAVD